MKGGTFLLQFINILVAGLSLDHMALFGILSPVRIGRIYIIRPTYLWRLKVRPKICRPNKLIPMETVLNLKLYLHFWCIRINRMTYNLYHIPIPFLLEKFNLCPFSWGLSPSALKLLEGPRSLYVGIAYRSAIIRSTLMVMDGRHDGQPGPWITHGAWVSRGPKQTAKRSFLLVKITSLEP